MIMIIDSRFTNLPIRRLHAVQVEFILGIMRIRPTRSDRLGKADNIPTERFHFSPSQLWHVQFNA